jgi:hypothetical protein
MTDRKILSASPREPSSAPTSRIPANVLPQGIGAANIGVILLLVADLGSLGGLLNHWILSIGRDTAALHDAVGDLAKNGGNFIGLLLGMELGLTGQIFPMQLLARRRPVAVKAYRILCRLILIGHLPLLLALGLDVSRQPVEAFFFLFLSAPLSLLGTPLLYPIWRVLRMRWLDLSAPPTDWEPMLGVDGFVKSDGLPPEPTATGIAMALPFVAAIRARQPVFAAIAFLLWAGALAMLFVAPLRAVVLFAVAAALGRYAAGRAGTASAPAIRSQNSPDRERRLHAIFRPASLTPPPRFQAVGLLALPALFILDALALGVGVGIAGADSLQGLGDLIEDWGMALLVIVPFVLMPAQMLMPSGSRLGLLLYRGLGGAIALAHLCLTGWFLAVSLHLQANRPPVQVLAEPMLLPLTFILAATLPLAAVLALSLAGKPAAAS